MSPKRNIIIQQVKCRVKDLDKIISHITKYSLRVENPIVISSNIYVFSIAVAVADEKTNQEKKIDKKPDYVAVLVCLVTYFFYWSSFAGFET